MAKKLAEFVFYVKPFPEVFGFLKNNNVGVNLIDTPGFNDGDSCDVIIKWFESNFVLLDVLVLISDVERTMQGASERELVKSIFESMKKQTEELCELIVLFNKFDEPDDEELIELMHSAIKYILSVADQHKVTTTKIHFFKMSAENAYIYRYFYYNRSLQNLPKKFVKKLGREQFGVAAKKMNPKKLEKELESKLSDYNYCEQQMEGFRAFRKFFQSNITVKVESLFFRKINRLLQFIYGNYKIDAHVMQWIFQLHVLCAKLKNHPDNKTVQKIVEKYIEENNFTVDQLLDEGVQFYPLITKFSYSVFGQKLFELMQKQFSTVNIIKWFREHDNDEYGLYRQFLERIIEQHMVFLSKNPQYIAVSIKTVEDFCNYHKICVQIKTKAFNAIIQRLIIEQLQCSGIFQSFKQIKLLFKIQLYPQKLRKITKSENIDLMNDILKKHCEEMEITLKSVDDVCGLLLQYDAQLNSCHLFNNILDYVYQPDDFEQKETEEEARDRCVIYLFLRDIATYIPKSCIIYRVNFMNVPFGLTNAFIRNSEYVFGSCLHFNNICELFGVKCDSGNGDDFDVDTYCPVVVIPVIDDGAICLSSFGFNFNIALTKRLR